jgi:hypothetical protein
MTTRSEEERLAVVEIQISTLQTDVTEIKSDVKSLVATQQQLAVALAVKNAAELQHEKSRASTGVWVRWVLPVAFTLVNGALTAIALIQRVH